MPKDSPDPLGTPLTLVDLLQARAAHQPDSIAYTFLANGETEAGTLTYRQLQQKAQAVAATLQRLGAAGERVLLVYPPGLDYLVAFWGCLLAGSVAVPVYPPDPARLNRTLPRFEAIVRDAQPKIALTTSPILTVALKLAASSAGSRTPQGSPANESAGQPPPPGKLHWVATDPLGEADAEGWQPPSSTPDTLAFLQYTSGSTSDPKGVMLSHRNLLSNLAMLHIATETTPASVFVSWLPLFHDMGLIATALHAVYVGAQCVLMAPEDFIKKPLRWLNALSRYRGTYACAPNFAFELCLHKISPEEQARLDLSSWITAVNGAEPVRSQTLRKFAQTFAGCGFRPEYVSPGYGLAEVGVFVSTGAQDSPPVVLTVDGALLEQGQVVEVGGDHPQARELVGCGRTWLDEKVLIVNPETCLPQPPDRVGEIWVSGPHVAQGYWNRPEASQETFHAHLPTGAGPFLRTGDLGFIRPGAREAGAQLFITGRIKDLIIIRGRNLYPQDIELTVENCHPALRPGCGAAFSVEAAGEERLVIVQEVRDGLTGSELHPLIETIRQAVTQAHEVQPYALALIQARTIHKTSSGKLQRQATRAAFLSGKLEVAEQWAQPPEPLPLERPAPADPLAPPAPPQGLPPQVEALQTWLVARIAAHLGVSPGEVDGRVPFARFGLDSKDAVGIAGELETRLGRTLPATLLYEYPTIELLAWQLAGNAEPSTGPAALPAGGAETREPVAIVGIGCRFPGAGDAQAFWGLLRDGMDAIREVPPDRWSNDQFYDPDPGAPGKINTRWGGFLDNIDAFDARFFGISPREAERMDPQQRLLMEVAWEALEDAGQPPDGLAGTPTGVFIGISTNEYQNLQFSDPELIDAYAGTGIALSIAANRLSYYLDLRGPSVALDTACSSSLLAIYLACQSIWQGDATMALAGGVGLILFPSVHISFTKAGALAPDGRCKTFDARANGYVRGEGAGIVVLKPLSQAIAGGDRIYAVIRGGAVNQDGRSNGLVAPNPLAQQAVLQQAYQNAGVSPGKIQYVEAHGTGTYLGDPIEANALGQVLSQDRPAGSSAAIGSVKTNIGHLEAAAGVAGLIKLALSLWHKAIPPSLHFETPNPLIAFDSLPLRVAQSLTPWPESDGPALAGISSFGFGGTNVHLVLEGAPDRAAEASLESGRACLLPISAKDEDALRGLARAYRETLTPEGGVSLQELCASASLRRSHHDHRLAIAARSRDELGEALDAFLAGEIRPGTFEGQAASRGAGKTVFVFPGQGSQWLGMGRELLRAEPGFRIVVEECDRLIERFCLHNQLSPWSLLDALGSPGDAWMEAIDQLQPAIFAIQVGLAALWRAWGIAPQAVVGHSMGEVAAAYVAGALSLEDAVEVICARSHQLRQAIGKGGMLVTGLPLEEALALEARFAGQVCVAVSNSPASTVLAGESQILDEILLDLEKRSVFARFVDARGAGHTPQMEPLKAALTQALAPLQPRPERVAIYSSVTGEQVSGLEMNAAYWGGNIRQMVRFSAAVQRLLADGYETFLEISPHPVLSSAIQQGLNHRSQALGAPLRGQVIPSLRRGEPERWTLLGSLGMLYTLGHAVAWENLAGPLADFVPLPLYPWQRKRYWLDVAAPAAAWPAGSARPVVAPETLQDWLYTVQWQARPLDGSKRTFPAGQGSWLIFADRGGVGQALAKALKKEGQASILVYQAEGAQPGKGGARSNKNTCAVRPGENEDYRQLLQTRFVDEGVSCRGVVHLWSLDAPGEDGLNAATLEAAQASICGSVLSLVQEVERRQWREPPPVWLVTRGAQAVGPLARPMARLSLAQVPLWGLGRSLALESPQMWGGLIDLLGESPGEAVESLTKELLYSDGEDQVAIGNGQRFVARLEKKAGSQPQSAPAGKAAPLFRADGAYLITGGLGGVGIELARWMVAQGARRLILVGRTEIPPRQAWAQIPEGGLKEKIRAIQSLEALGASVHLAAVDVGDEAQLSGFLETYAQEGWPPVRGVFHLAAVVEGEFLREHSLARMQSVLRPKMTGAWLLHKLVAPAGELDYFVLFSSAAAVLSSPMLGSYAAANAFLDALASFRRAEGKPALSINWGAWAEAGLAVRYQQETQREMTPKGMRAFTTAQGMEALGHLLRQSLESGSLDGIGPNVAVMDFDWQAWQQYHPTAAQAPLLSNLMKETGRPGVMGKQKPGATAQPGLASSLEGLFGGPQGERLRSMEAYLRQQVGAVLYLAPASIPTEVNLTTLGLDSLMAMELLRRIERDLQLRLFPREVFERPSIARLSVYLIGELDAHRGQSAQGPAQTSSEEALARIAEKMFSGPASAPLAGVAGAEHVRPGVRNPSAVFLLSAPRSGSTLLRVMLAGHPALFSPPELHLLPFAAMRQRKQDLGPTYLDEGLQMALMNLQGLTVEESKTLVEGWIAEDKPIQEVYRTLQELAGGRTLVDKSPTYGISLAILERAEALFEGARYIHLVRHPYPAIESAARVRFDKLLGAGEVNPFEFGEQIWATLNQNILEFAEKIGPERCCRVYYEDLVRGPESEMRRLCGFLGIPFDEAVTRPYEGERMTGGLYDVSISLGDENLARRKAIDPALAEHWKTIVLPRRLSQATQKLATGLGYELPQEAARPAMSPLVPIQPKGTKPPFFLVHPGGGLVYFFYELGQLFGAEQPFYGLQDPSLGGDRRPHAYIEDYAREYLAAIRSVQPEGPYHIGGWSFGGHVAFEMGRALKAAGQEVALLMIIDTEAALGGRQPTLRQRWFFWRTRVIELGFMFNDMVPYIRDGLFLTLRRRQMGEDHPAAGMSRLEYMQWAWSDTLYKMFARRAGIEEVISRDASLLRMRIPTIRRVLYVLGHHLQAARRYRPGVYTGDAILLRAGEQISRQYFSDDTLGWGGLISGKLEVWHAPGNHVTLFEQPHIQAVARMLQAALGQQREASSP